MPPAGFRPQQRLGGGQDRLVVRFVPEDVGRLAYEQRFAT